MVSLRQLAFGALLVTAATLAAMTPIRAQALDGGALFKQRCSVCHKITPDGASAVGPNLRGVAGRKAGTTKFAYSPALGKSGMVWTSANLDKYLTSPMKAVPGTKMAIAVPDAAQRKAIIAYLATQK